MQRNNLSKKGSSLLFNDISAIINQRKRQVSYAVNSNLILLYWEIGNRINKDILNNQRAAYSKQIIFNLSQKLTGLYGRGWDEKTLRHCLHAVETMSKDRIDRVVKQNLTWSHLKTIIYLSDPLARDFYIEICIQENWSVRTLQSKIDSMLYERTAISKKPKDVISRELEKLRSKNEISQDLVFRDPYILNFLGLEESFSEKNLEMSILREMEKFILELGQGFSFIERQKRILMDGEDFWIDLLFYHRKLKRLVVVELKLGKFKAAYKAQMELYLKWLKKHDKNSGENDPIGLILCAEGNREQIELLELDKSGIKVAQYLTALPSKKVLKQKLQTVIELSAV